MSRAGSPAGTTVVAGRVYDESRGTGIAGVAVSDGLAIVPTDGGGRYRLPVDGRRRHSAIVFVTVPSGWQAPPDAANTPAFFRRLDGSPASTSDVDFGLRVDPDSEDDSYRFIALTDTHVSPEHINTSAVYRSLLQQIDAHAHTMGTPAEQPRFVVVSGDLTNHGTPAEFADYREATAVLSRPVWSLPGNHDLPRPRLRGQPGETPDPEPHYRDRVEGYRRAIGPEWYSFQYGPHHFVVLENHYGFAQPDQLAWLEQDLALHAKDRPVVVVTHVPWNVPETPPAEQLDPYRALLERHDVRLVLAGHTHANDVAVGVLGHAVHAVTTSAVYSLDYSPIGFRVVDVGNGTITLPFHEFTVGRPSSTARVPAGPEGQAASDPPRMGAPWPMFHGDARHSGWTPDAVAPPLVLAWTAPTGGRVLSSSPALASGAVFIGVRDEDGTDANAVVALDLPTGHRRWRAPAAGVVEASVAVVGDVVVVPAVRGPLHAFDASTGTARWEWRPEQADARPCWMYFSPTVAGHTVFQAYSDPGGTWVAAVDGRTGRTQWSLRQAVGLDWISHGAPAVDGDLLVFAAAHAHLVGVDATDGTVRWLSPLGGGLGVRAKPVIAGGIVLLARQGDCLVAVDAGTGAWAWTYEAEGAPLLPGAHTAATPSVADGEVYAAFCDGSIAAIDVETGSRRWRHQTEGAVLSSPAVSGEFLYVGSNDGRLRALERATGDCVWAHDIGSWVASSPAVTGNAVVVAAWDGSVYAFASDRSA